MEFKDSRTAQNLLKAFAGESQARNRYTFAAEIARKEGLEHVAAGVRGDRRQREGPRRPVLQGAGQAGARRAWRSPPAIPWWPGDTAAQLKAAVSGENEEWSALYPEFARIAREEDFPEAARAFEWHRQGGEGARGPFPPPARPRGQRHCLPARRKDLLALPGVRPHPRGPRRPQGLPRLPQAPGLLRPGGREVLGPSPCGRLRVPGSRADPPVRGPLATSLYVCLAPPEQGS